jgi:anti-sigma factor RsiW
MKLCGQDGAALAAYLDGEIAGEQEKLLQQHLRTCSECAAEIAAMVSLRRAMKPAATRFAASAEFRQKVQVQIAPRRSVRRQWLWPAAVAALVMMMAALVWTRQNALRSEAFREVADLHVSDLASANPYDVVSSDRHTVKPWFQGRIPFAFNLPELAGTEFTLLGGRLVYLHQQPAAQMVVSLHQHKISVLIVQEGAEANSEIPGTSGVEVRDSFNVETWQDQGLRFFVIGDADKSAIEHLAETLRSANQ